MSWRNEASLVAWISAGVLVVSIAASLLLSGCKAFAEAAPQILETVDRVIEAELEAAEDEQRERELRRAQLLLEECRRALAAAEDAARRATEAAVLAQEAAAGAAKEQERAERALAETAQLELRASLRRLRIRVPAQAPSTDAGMLEAPAADGGSVVP